MRLIKLHLRNFRGHESLTIEPQGKSLNIFGKNYLGKTTIADAGTYIITGKDTQDRSPSSFGIKTRKELPDGSLGDEIHGLEHAVEAVYKMSDGRMLTLKKIYREQWTTPRGQAEEELTGHTTDYHWDGEPNVKKSEYEDRLEEYITQEEYKMLSLPDYFASQMHWTDRRNILEGMIGEVTDTEIVEVNPYLEGYIELLDGKTQDAVEKTLKEQKKNLKKELGTRTNPGKISTRIDESKGYIEELEKDPKEAKDQIKNLKKKKDKIEAKRSEVKSGGTIAELKVERNELQAEKQEAKNNHQKNIQENLSEKRKKVSDIQNKVDEAESDWREAKREYETLEDRLNNKQQDIEAIKKELQNITDREPKPASDFGPDVCPVCERPMEDGEEHDYEAYLEEFNEKKADDIKAKNIELQEVGDEAETVAAQLEIAKDNASKANGKLSQRKQALDKAQVDLKEAKEKQPEFSDTDEFQEIQDQINEIDSKIKNHQAEKESQLKALENEIGKIDQQIAEHKEVVDQAKINKKYRDRIEELQQLRKKYGQQLDEVETGLRLIDDFKRAKARYIEDAVNDKFKHVTWQMFDPNISGSVDEVCNAVYKSRPFDILSTSEKIFAGLDIINTLSEHFGKSVPVWIDNRESITKIPDNDLQVISLIVTEDDDQLRIVPVDEPQKEKAVA